MKKEGELFPSLETRRFFTVKEAARLLGMSVPGLHIWIKKGRIRRPSRISKGGGYRIPREEIKRLLKSAGRQVPGLWTAKRTKVLLIEDDPQLRELVAQALRNPRFGAEVQTAATPEDGLLMVVPFAPDILLLDHFAPKTGMSSDQTLSILRRAKTLRGVKIIGLWPENAAPIRAAKPDAFLPKPFGAEDLREALFGTPPRLLARSGRSHASKSDRRRWEYKISQQVLAP